MKSQLTAQILCLPSNSVIQKSYDCNRRLNEEPVADETLIEFAQ